LQSPVSDQHQLPHDSNLPGPNTHADLVAVPLLDRHTADVQYKHSRPASSDTSGAILGRSTQAEAGLGQPTRPTPSCQRWKGPLQRPRKAPGLFERGASMPSVCSHATCITGPVRSPRPTAMTEPATTPTLAAAVPGVSKGRLDPRCLSACNRWSTPTRPQSASTSRGRSVDTQRLLTRDLHNGAIRPPRPWYNDGTSDNANLGSSSLWSDSTCSARHRGASIYR
jgi:hypothetical protein